LGSHPAMTEDLQVLAVPHRVVFSLASRRLDKCTSHHP
jgi:hypothetical protein